MIFIFNGFKTDPNWVLLKYNIDKLKKKIWEKVKNINSAFFEFNLHLVFHTLLHDKYTGRQARLCGEHNEQKNEMTEKLKCGKTVWKWQAWGVWGTGVGYMRNRRKRKMSSSSDRNWGCGWWGTDGWWQHLPVEWDSVGAGPSLVWGPPPPL